MFDAEGRVGGERVKIAGEQQFRKGFDCARVVQGAQKADADAFFFIADFDGGAGICGAGTCGAGGADGGRCGAQKDPVLSFRKDGVQIGIARECRFGGALQRGGADAAGEVDLDRGGRSACRGKEAALCGGKGQKARVVLRRVGLSGRVQ